MAYVPIFKLKIQIWVNFGGSWNGSCWYIICKIGLFGVIWSILGLFGISFPVLVCCTKRNLATLVTTTKAGRCARNHDLMSFYEIRFSETTISDVEVCSVYTVALGRKKVLKS
jgi:hypothetical protein